MLLRLASRVIATFAGSAASLFAVAAPEINAVPMFAESPIGRSVFVLELRNDSDAAANVIASFSPPPQACGLMALEKVSWLNKDGRPFEYDGSPGLIKLSAHSRTLWQLPLLTHYSALNSSCRILYEFDVGDKKWEGGLNFDLPHAANFSPSGSSLNFHYAFYVSKNAYSNAIVVNLLLKKIIPTANKEGMFRVGGKYLENCPGKDISDGAMVVEEYRGNGAAISGKNLTLLTTAIVSRQEFNDPSKCKLIVTVDDVRGKSESIVIPIDSTAEHFDRRFSIYQR